MTGGPAAANSIVIFSIPAQGNTTKNRSWERSPSSGTAYVIDLLHVRNYRLDTHAFRLLLISLRKSSTVYEAP
jgi:hypothetical protein